MALNPKVTKLASGKIRLTWTPDFSGQGYRLYRDGIAVSRTFKPDAASSDFSAETDGQQHRYGVVMMDEVGSVENVEYPPDPEPEPTPGTRDAALWPFTATSPWNMPIGSGAQYAAETSPVWNPASGGAINNDNGWSIPVFLSDASDPLVNIYDGGGFKGQMRVPTNAAPATQSDAHCCIIDTDNDKLLETYGSFNRSGDRITAQHAVFNSVKDAGVYSGWHGMRAYGGSALAGLIRKEEIASRNIPHALAMAVQRDAMNKNTPNGQAFVWPASNADSGWQTSYGSMGNLHMGSLVAIPPSVDLNALGLNALALAVAKAMQDYGCYVVDAASAGSARVLYSEPGTGSSFDGATTSGITKANAYLQVVTNNRADNVGGGGTPRRPLAPAFA